MCRLRGRYVNCVKIYCVLYYIAECVDSVAAMINMCNLDILCIYYIAECVDSVAAMSNV